MTLASQRNRPMRKGLKDTGQNRASDKRGSAMQLLAAIMPHPVFYVLSPPLWKFKNCEALPAALSAASGAKEAHREEISLMLYKSI